MNKIQQSPTRQRHSTHNLITPFLLLFCFNAVVIRAEQSPTSTAKMSANQTAMVHDHQPVQIPKTAKQPRLSIQLSKDKKDGYNLHLSLQNYQIGPPTQKQKRQSVLNGHAHLYINGQKIRRLYATDTHIPSSQISNGINQIMVSLNAHDHKVWSQGNKQILSSVIIDADAGEHFLVYQFDVYSIAR